jgi:hypothetical protein
MMSFERSMNAEESSKKLSERQSNPTESGTDTEFQIWLSLPFHNLPVVLDPAMSVRQSLVHDFLDGARNIFSLLGVHSHDSYPGGVHILRWGMKALTAALARTCLDRRKVALGL